MTIELPEHLKSGPLFEAAKKSLQDAASMASASNSVPRVSLRGREFRFIENGEEIAKFRDSIDIIILGVEPDQGRMIKTFYAKGYQPGVKEPPTCSSDDGIAPSPWVNEKQAQSCQTCPKNVFGSATSPTGKATKACRDSKRIWIVLANDPKPIEERTMFGMNVTVASLKSFSEHGRMLASQGQGPAVCVTTATMLDTEFPQVEFSLKAWLPVEQVGYTLKASNERPWKMFSSAGLALAMNESASKGSTLPTMLPGQSVVGAAPASAPTKPVADKPVADIDDAVGKW
jgi:hypothetical protein